MVEVEVEAHSEAAVKGDPRVRGFELPVKTSEIEAGDVDLDEGTYALEVYAKKKICKPYLLEI